MFAFLVFSTPNSFILEISVRYNSIIKIVTPELLIILLYEYSCFIRIVG